jgi:uncharacterized repeat protein (TIGR01451 family)
MLYFEFGRSKLFVGVLPMNVRHLVTVSVCAMLLFSPSAVAAFLQQGPKLVGTGAIGQAEQGASVSISSDGNTAVVGGPADNSVAGAAWVWVRSGGVWTQQGSKLVGSGATGVAIQGNSVAISGDGNTIIVGGPNDNNAAGAAWVWTRSGGVWTQQGSKLVGSGGSAIAQQGFSVSLSSDGNTAIVGGNKDNSDAGAAWVWTRSGGVWTQQGSKLVGTGAVGTANQGYSVSLSGDGNTAFVGGPNDNGSAGAAWVWTRSGGVWTQQGSKLVGSGAVSGAQQGSSVSVSGDSNTAIVGGWHDNSNVGAAWVWTRSGGIWTQQGSKLLASDAVGTAEQGFSVSLASDGNTAFIGGDTDNSTVGAAWAWTRSGGVWTQQGSKLVGSGAVGNALQGFSVSLSGDSTTAIVGGVNDNGTTGAAWVYAAVAASADVSITKSANGGPPFPAGGNVSYTLTAANAGSSSATNVTVTDVLPAGTTFVSATPTQGTCNGTTTVTCSLGTLASGANATIALVLTTSSTPGTVSNTATVSATETDPNPVNNSSTSLITTVSAPAAPVASAWVLMALAGMLALLGALKHRG